MRTLHAIGLAAAAIGLAGAAAAAEGGGLPQLNTATFPTQIFWSLVFFALIYLLMSRIALPRIGAVLQDRSQQLDGDLDAAARLKADTQEAEAKYEAALTDSREQARSLIRDASEAAAADAAAKDGAFTETLVKRANEAAQRIDAARDSALAEIRPAAAELARETVKKLAGFDVDAAGARAAVDAVFEQRG